MAVAISSGCQVRWRPVEGDECFLTAELAAPLLANNTGTQRRSLRSALQWHLKDHRPTLPPSPAGIRPFSSLTAYQMTTLNDEPHSSVTLAILSTVISAGARPKQAHRCTGSTQFKQTCGCAVHVLASAIQSLACEFYIFVGATTALKV